MRKDFFSKAIMCLDSRYYEKIVWKPIYLDWSLPLAPHIRGGTTSFQIALFQKGGNVTESKWHIPSFQRRRACEFHNQKKAEGLDAMAVFDDTLKDVQYHIGLYGFFRTSPNHHPCSGCFLALWSPARNNKL